MVGMRSLLQCLQVKGVKVSKQLLTVLYQGFAEWEVVFPLFCLHPAIGARYVTLGENRLRGAMGFEIKGDWSLENVNPREFDGIYLPGGLDPKTNQFPRSLGEHEQLLKLLFVQDPYILFSCFL